MGKAEGVGENWHGHVTALTVAPEYRRLGLANQLMDILEDISEKWVVLISSLEEAYLILFPPEIITLSQPITEEDDSSVLSYLLNTFNVELSLTQPCKHSLLNVFVPNWQIYVGICWPGTKFNDVYIFFSYLYFHKYLLYVANSNLNCQCWRIASYIYV